MDPSNRQYIDSHSACIHHVHCSYEHRVSSRVHRMVPHIDRWVHSSVQTHTYHDRSNRMDHTHRYDHSWDRTSLHHTHTSMQHQLYQHTYHDSCTYCCNGSCRSQDHGREHCSGIHVRRFDRRHIDPCPYTWCRPLHVAHRLVASSLHLRIQGHIDISHMLDVCHWPVCVHIHHCCCSHWDI